MAGKQCTPDQALEHLSAIIRARARGMITHDEALAEACDAIVALGEYHHATIAARVTNALDADRP